MLYSEASGTAQSIGDWIGRELVRGMVDLLEGKLKGEKLVRGPREIERSGGGRRRDNREREREREGGKKDCNRSVKATQNAPTIKQDMMGFFLKSIPKS